MNARREASAPAPSIAENNAAIQRLLVRGVIKKAPENPVTGRHSILQLHASFVTAMTVGGIRLPPLDFSPDAQTGRQGQDADQATITAALNNFPTTADSAADADPLEGSSTLPKNQVNVDAVDRGSTTGTISRQPVDQLVDRLPKRRKLEQLVAPLVSESEASNEGDASEEELEAASAAAQVQPSPRIRGQSPRAPAENQTHNAGGAASLEQDGDFLGKDDLLHRLRAAKSKREELLKTWRRRKDYNKKLRNELQTIKDAFLETVQDSGRYKAKLGSDGDNEPEDESEVELVAIHAPRAQGRLKQEPIGGRMPLSQRFADSSDPRGRWVHLNHGSRSFDHRSRTGPSSMESLTGPFTSTPRSAAALPLASSHPFAHVIPRHGSLPQPRTYSQSYPYRAPDASSRLDSSRQAFSAALQVDFIPDYHDADKLAPAPAQGDTDGHASAGLASSDSFRQLQSRQGQSITERELPTGHSSTMATDGATRATRTDSHAWEQLLREKAARKELETRQAGLEVRLAEALAALAKERAATSAATQLAAELEDRLRGANAHYAVERADLSATVARLKRELRSLASR